MNLLYIRLNVFVWEKYNINYLQIFGFEATKGVSYFMEFFEVCIVINLKFYYV